MSSVGGSFGPGSLPLATDVARGSGTTLPIADESLAQDVGAAGPSVDVDTRAHFDHPDLPHSLVHALAHATLTPPESPVAAHDPMQSLLACDPWADVPAGQRLLLDAPAVAGTLGPQDLDAAAEAILAGVVA